MIGLDQASHTSYYYQHVRIIDSRRNIQRSAEAPVPGRRSIDSGSQEAKRPVPRARSVMDLSRMDFSLPSESTLPRNKSEDSLNSSDAPASLTKALPRPRPRTQMVPDELSEGSSGSKAPTSPKKAPPSRGPPTVLRGTPPPIPSRGPPPVVPGRGGPPPVPSAKPVGVTPAPVLAPVPAPRRDIKSSVDTAIGADPMGVGPAHRPSSQHPAADEHSAGAAKHGDKTNGIVGNFGAAQKVAGPPPIPPRQGPQH